MIKETNQVTSKPQSVVKRLLTDESSSIRETFNNTRILKRLKGILI